MTQYSSTMNPRESHLQAKKEDDPNYSYSIDPKIPPSSRRWSVHKNPRIVRVSRTFGGKDRHSKVCTVRGLRDRRIRLSVPTAIQLYDLQDRLGVGQPSKVVDWLLEATKTDIDKLPPLPTLPLFTHLTHPPLPPNPQPHFLTAKDLGFVPIKDVIKTSENREGLGGFEAQNLFPLGNQSVFPNMSYNPYSFHLDNPNMALSQFGGGFPSFPHAQTDNDHPQSHNTLLSSLLPSNSHLYFSPSATTVSTNAVSSFPYSISNESRQFNHSPHFQQSSLLPTTLNLISSNVNSNKHIYPQENDHTGRSRKDNNKDS